MHEATNELLDIAMNGTTVELARNINALGRKVFENLGFQGVCIDMTRIARELEQTEGLLTNIQKVRLDREIRSWEQKLLKAKQRKKK